MESPTPHQNNKLALVCTIHTSSPSATQRYLDLLSSARSYYTQDKAQCTTWAYLKPSSRAKAPSQLIKKASRDTTICGVEIYSDKHALSTQQEEAWFKDFQNRAKEESLYGAKGEELVAWYLTAGFVARTKTAGPYGGIVMFALFTCKEGKRDTVVKVLANYTKYVHDKEPGVLTYCTMTRPKAPNEILLFERYKDVKALAAHGSTNEFKAMFKEISADVEMKQTKLQEFSELNSAFVSNVIGGGSHGPPPVAAASKL